jgi:uncharacterized protein YabN with tetrapyrrole methylase and pyrophosphatase domain
MGDLLFSLVNLSRFLNVSAEDALRASTRKFESRFKAIERAAERQGRDLNSMTLTEMDALWSEVKKSA